MKHIPNKIYLNIGCDPKEVKDFSELSEVTWCADKINDNDIEYQRKPIWHDLRKNPNDLPEIFDVVIVCVKRVSGHTESLIGYNDGGIWFVEQGGEEPNVIAWMDIPEFK